MEGGAEKLLKDSAQISAQATAIVIARLQKGLGKGNTEVKIDDTGFASHAVSRIIKIYNVFDRSKSLTD